MGLDQSWSTPFEARRAVDGRPSGGSGRRGRFSDEFNAGAVRQVLEDGNSVSGVAKELNPVSSRAMVEYARADLGGARVAFFEYYCEPTTSTSSEASPPHGS